MTYSIEILNQYNERALDFESVYYVHEYGSCFNWPARSGSNLSAGEDAHVACPFGYGVYSPVCDKGLVADFYGSANWVSLEDGSTVKRLPQFAGGDTTTYLYRTGIPGRTDTEVPYVVPDLDTEIFFQLPPEGLTYASTYLQRYQQFGAGVVGVCQPYHTFVGGVNYIFARPSEPSGGVSETHGMQLFDTSGGRVFDSRYEVISIKDHISISESDMRDILVNGNSKTYNLRQPVNNPYISSGDFTALTFDSRPVNEIMSLPRMTLVNGNQLVVDRISYQGGQPGAGYFFDGSSASTILIAEVNEQ